MKPAAGVVPAAFDTSLIGTSPSGFVYRNLANTSLDIVAGTSTAVTNHADEMALMNRIAPSKRVRGNVEKWASVDDLDCEAAELKTPRGTRMRIRCGRSAPTSSA